MPCFHPREIRVNKFRAVYNWITLPDGSVKREKRPIGLDAFYYIQVPCGKCPHCLALLQSQWSFRIEQEALSGKYPSLMFVTFTYDPQHLPEGSNLVKEHVQRYLRNLRQNLKRRYFDGTNKETLPELFYYFCGEYGSKFGRPHYHAILGFTRSIDWHIVQSSWGKGIVDIREFSLARAGYVAKYSVKQMELDYNGRSRPFHLQSKGLGACFLKDKSIQSLNYNFYYSNLSGRKVKLPRYYLDKLGTTRSYSYRFLPTGEVVKKSSTSHSFAYDRAVASAMLRYQSHRASQMARLNMDELTYDNWLDSNHANLESLLKLRSLSSSYYEKSRIGM